MPAPETGASAGVGGNRPGRPRKRAESFFALDEAAKLLRTSPAHLRVVLAARFSFFKHSKCAGDSWKVSRRDLERLLGTEHLRPMLRVGEVARLMRTTRAKVMGYIRRGELRAVKLFGSDRCADLRLNWLTVARAIGQENGGIAA